MSRIGIGKGIGRRRHGINWASYWAHSNLFLFFASDNTDILNKVVATQLPNQVTGAIDYLTVTGAGLNARYRTPDNATYRAADTDYVFWKTDASESTCDGNRLIGYDFPRILVKYLNVAPYTILWIGILNPGVTVTNQMRDSFDLSIWWDNTLSSHGNLKGNRGVGQSVWPPESCLDAATTALVARMTALSEIPDAARIIVLDNTIKADKLALGFSTKYDALWLTAAHGIASAKLNIIANAFNITEVDTPTFTIDRGFTGNGSSDALNCNYTPATQAVLYTQNACSFGIYLRLNKKETTLNISANSASDAGIYFLAWNTDSKYYVCCNSNYASNNNIDATSEGMWIVSRSASNSFIVYHNGVNIAGGPHTTVSATLVNVILHLLCRNVAGTLNNFSTNEIALAFVGGYMTQTEVTAFQTIWVDGYLNSVGAKI